MIPNFQLLFLILLKVNGFIPSTFYKKTRIIPILNSLKTEERENPCKSIFSGKDSTVSYGDYDSGKYCKYRNIYYFPDNNNIHLISKSNVKRLFYGWRMSLLNSNMIYDDDFKNFHYHLNDENTVYFSWVPHNNKDYVRGLIAANVNEENEIIKIKSILLAPPKDEKIIHQADNFVLLVSDLDHLKFIYNWMHNLKIDLNSI